MVAERSSQLSGIILTSPSFFTATFFGLFFVSRRSMVNGHAPVSHKVKHQDELRGITAKLIKIDKLEVG